MKHSYSRIGRLASLSIGGALLLCISLVHAAVPTPVVTGPIPSPDVAGSPGHNYTFFATDLNFRDLGYVEEEFFISGTANVYDTPNPGGGIGAIPTAYPVANIVSTGHPYKTRIVVRRPNDPTKYNGVAILEWTNVTNNYDNEAFWYQTNDYLIRSGFAHVAVSAQAAGIDNAATGLKAWSPVRYGTLDVRDGGKVNGDALAYDIFSQAAQAVRSVPVVMGGLSTRIIIGAGTSQSAGHLAPYVNAVHPLSHVIDAAFLQVGGQIIRNDIDIPVFKVLSESEYVNYPSDYEVNVLQPDTDRFRVWGVAGTSHSDWYVQTMRQGVIQRDLGLPFNDTCDFPSRSRVQMRYVMNAALHHMIVWVNTGVSPPVAPSMQLTSAATPVAARDAYGNALGGIRNAEFAVPIALDNGTNSGPGLCFLRGTHVPFDQATLDALYPSHGAYMSAIAHVASENVRAGFLLEEDAESTKADAASSLVGTGLACGTLCLNIGQFAQHPSTTLLRDRTAFYRIVGGDALVETLNEATRQIATGYTFGNSAKGRQGFANGAALVRQYIAQVRQLEAEGHIVASVADMLVDDATALVAALNEL